MRTFWKWLTLTGTSLVLTAFPARLEEPHILRSLATETSLNSHISAPLDDPSFSEKSEVPAHLISQTVLTEIPQTQDGERFQQLMQFAVEQNLATHSMNEIVQAIAKQLLGSTYKAGLLDESSEEILVVSLTEFDCVLFIEAVLAIARSVALQDYAYPTFVQHIQQQRYWDGHLQGYCSRLHYFSDWIDDNQKRGLVENIGTLLGAIPLEKTLNFMTQHRSSYSQMANNEENYRCIQQREASNTDRRITYIPTDQIRQRYSQLQAGDIIAVATDISGLDVTHTGLVYRHDDGHLGLIHASPIGEVTIAYDLQDYITKVESAIGILVARPLDPRQAAQ